MKKILLTAAIVAVSSTALATMTAEKGCWYAKANVGVAKFQKNTGYKSKTDGLATIAVGYNMMDNLRADLSLDHFFDPKLTSETATYKNTLKLDVNSLMLNVYADLVDASMAKVFVGAGVGMARVGGKQVAFTKPQAAVVADPNANPPVVASPAVLESTLTTKLKSHKSFSYALYAGVSAEVDNGVYAELTYAFKNLGKHTKLKTSGVRVLTKSLKGHNVTIGMRFDI